MEFRRVCGYSLWVVDIDGVVWRGLEPIRENILGLKTVMERGARVVFLTNNSTRHRRVYASRLSRLLGFRVDYRSVYTSGYMAARWLKERRGCSRVYVIGEEGLVEELVEACHVLVGIDEVEECSVDSVVVGLDRLFSYAKLRAGFRAIKYCGAVFVATNTDRSLPVERGEDPGAGAMVEALKASTSVEPVFVAGKPNPWVLEAILRDHGAGREEVIVVGDRIETDVELALRSGVQGLLVLTGVSRESSVPRGVAVYNTISDFIASCG